MRTAGAAVASIVVGGLVGVGAWAVGGLEPGWAALIALPCAAFTLLFSLAPAPGEPVWHPLPEAATGPADHQAALLAGRLVEAADDPIRFRERVRPRLRRLALARLRERPETRDLSTVDDPRAVALLGEDLYRLLTDRDVSLPDAGRTETLLARLEEL